MSRLNQFLFCSNSFSKSHFSVKAGKKGKAYTNTIQLPRTKFPARIVKNKRAELDETIIKSCGFNTLYEWQRRNLSGPEFVLHDGPPYANGLPHMGHAINKILKDIITRSNVIRGRKVHYVPGWDCHGLPIEIKVLQGKDHFALSPMEIRTEARGIAQLAIEDQKSVFRSWGVMADWEKQCYHTFDVPFVGNQLMQFYNLFQKGLIYRDLKPVYWSPSSRTALAEAELEYNPKHESTALTLRMRMSKLPDCLKVDNNQVYSLIWTTTPWSLPANQAIAVHPSLKYALVTLDDPKTFYIVGVDLLNDLEAKLNRNVDICSTFMGKELLGATYYHPLSQEELPVLLGHHVTSDAGTGIVHTAPSHGPDDYLLAVKNKIPIRCLVNDESKYTPDAGEGLSGLPVLKEGSEKVVKILSQDILHKETIVHSYPCDWRTKKPVIIRASMQWFFDTNAIKERAVALANSVPMYPKKNAAGLVSQVDRRPYWCISRQRAWGVPIPALYTKDSHKPIISGKLMDHYLELLEKRGPDFWWVSSVEDLLPERFAQELGVAADQVVKGMDILDIWFDSGLSWSAVLGESVVADLYLEGLDQYTGWFQSSLLTSTALKDRPPFKALFVHGFAVDEMGRKMSKSVGNVVDPQDITRGGQGPKGRPPLGVDALRWWVAAHGAQHTSVPVSPETLGNSLESIQKLRNILKFLLGALDDFKRPSSPPSQMYLVDKYMLCQLEKFRCDISTLYEGYQFGKVCSALLNFVANQVSGLYCHITKDRLYCEEADSWRRRAVQYTLSETLRVLCMAFGPILPILCEEVALYHPGNIDGTPFFHRIHSGVDLSHIVNPSSVLEIFDEALSLRTLVAKESPLNINKLELSCTVIAQPPAWELLKELQSEEVSESSELCEILQVAQVRLAKGATPGEERFSLELSHCRGHYCERCRKFSSTSVGGLCERCSNVLASLSTHLNQL